MAAEKTFPIMQSRESKTPHPMSVPWSVAELAYSGYIQRNGKCQSLERIAERGGFYSNEMDDYVPDWRKLCDVNAQLTSRIAALEAENARLRRFKNEVIGARVMLSSGIIATPDEQKKSTLYIQAAKASQGLKSSLEKLEEGNGL